MPIAIFFGFQQRKRRDLTDFFSAWPIYFSLITFGLPLAFDRGRKFVRNCIKCLFCCKLNYFVLIWTAGKKVQCQNRPLGKPYLSAVLFWSCQLATPWSDENMILVLLTSDISISIVHLLFKEFSLKLIILKNYATEKKFSEKGLCGK